jgi:hypothetical protein
VRQALRVIEPPAESVEPAHVGADAACPERCRRVRLRAKRARRLLRVIPTRERSETGGIRFPYFRPRRTAVRKTSQASLHFSNLDRLPRLSGYSINDFNSSTTRTGITYQAFIGRA